MKKIIFVIVGLIVIFWAMFTGYLFSWKMQEKEKLASLITKTCVENARKDFELYQQSLIETYKKNGFLEILIDNKQIKLYATPQKDLLENQQ